MADGFENRPQPHAAKIQPAEVFRKRNRTPAQRHRVLPQLSIEPAGTVLITQGALQ